VTYIHFIKILVSDLREFPAARLKKLLLFAFATIGMGLARMARAYGFQYRQDAYH